MAKITVIDKQITILNIDDEDYISLIDMANAKEGINSAADVIKNWLRTRYALEFMSVWELIHNPNLKVVRFDHF